MNRTPIRQAFITVDTELVGADHWFSFVEMCRVCSAEPTLLIELVSEGVLEPTGSDPANWRFNGLSLRRARVALRLSGDLELGSAATALVLDLLARIDALEVRLQHAGLR